MPEGEGGNTTTTTTTDPAAGNGNGNAGGNGDGGTTASKTFTQDDVNRIVKERAERMLKQQIGDLDPAELRRKAEEFDRLSEAQKTELEKAVDKARREAGADATKATDEKWANIVRRAEIRVAAAGKLADPEDAIRFLDLATIKVDDEGHVDEKAIASAIETLVTEKPYLAADGGSTTTTRRTADFDPGTRTTTTTAAGSSNDADDPLLAALSSKVGLST